MFGKARFTPHHPWGTRAQPAGVASNHQPTVPEGQPRMFSKPVQTLYLFRFRKYDQQRKINNLKTFHLLEGCYNLPIGRFAPHHSWGTRAQPAGIASKFQPTVPEGQPRMFSNPVWQKGNPFPAFRFLIKKNLKI